jgi:hypothetical protein
LLSLGVWAYIRWDIVCCCTYVFSVVMLCVVRLCNQFLFLAGSLTGWELTIGLVVFSSVKVQVLVFVEVLVCCVQHELKFYLNICFMAWKLCIYTCLSVYLLLLIFWYYKFLLCSDNVCKCNTVFAQILHTCKPCIQFVKKRRKRFCEFIEGLLIHVTFQLYVDDFSCISTITLYFPRSDIMQNKWYAILLSQQWHCLIAHYCSSD